MKDNRPRRDRDKNGNVGDCLSLRRPCKALTLALGQFTPSVPGSGESSIKPCSDVDMEIQTRLMDNVPPFAGNTIQVNVAITRCKCERGHSTKAASDRHRNPGSNSECSCFIEELTLLSIPGGCASRSSPAEKISFVPGSKDHRIELLISKLKIAHSPGFRVGRDQHRRIAVQAQIGKTLKAEPLG